MTLPTGASQAGCATKVIIRVLTDIRALDMAASSRFTLEALRLAPAASTFRRAIDVMRLSHSCDYIVLNNGSNRLILMLALLKIVLPTSHARIVAVDMLLSAPRTWRARLKAAVIRMLMRKIYLFILYYRDTRALERTYSIPAAKFRFVPFKVNQAEYVASCIPSDGGYVFCGGKTRRDFATLFAAVRDLPIPVKVVTAPNHDIAQHGSYLDQTSAPQNVEVVILKKGHEEFINLMANARLVVQPIVPDVCAAGIGVNLMALALGKCLVVTSGPGVEDTLPGNAAIVVPPMDPAALKSAILRAYEDEALRLDTGKKGHLYATQLGGEHELMQSIADILYQDMQQRNGRRVRAVAL